MKLKSPAFREGEATPGRYAGEGEDLSPPLRWSDVPEGTHEFVLVCEDPDAAESNGGRPWSHWVIYNISPSVTYLPEGLRADAERLDLPVRADQGTNDFGRLGYGGPMPPPGDGPHRYVFRLHALDSELGLRPRASRDDLLRAIEGHVLATAELSATYRRVRAQAEVA